MPSELHEATSYAPKVLDSQIGYSHPSPLSLMGGRNKGSDRQVSWPSQSRPLPTKVSFRLDTDVSFPITCDRNQPKAATAEIKLTNFNGQPVPFLMLLSLIRKISKSTFSNPYFSFKIVVIFEIEAALKKVTLRLHPFRFDMFFRSRINPFGLNRSRIKKPPWR